VAFNLFKFESKQLQTSQIVGFINQLKGIDGHESIQIKQNLIKDLLL